MVNLTINDRRVVAREGDTVLQAAKREDIYIPTLCYYPPLVPYGGCRLCIVKIENMRGFPTSCTTPVSEGMVVHTDTPEIQELRRSTMELILSEHPYFCAICQRRERCESFSPGIQKTDEVYGCHTCPANGRCELQKVVEYLGLREMSLTYHPRALPVLRDSPFFDRDYNLCILCGRCVRVCQELLGVAAIAFTYRGSKVLVGTAFGQSLQDAGCQFCGACVDACPTASLVERASKWTGLPDASVLTTCPYCGAGCQLNLEVKGRRISASVPAEGGVNQGLACVKGRFAVRELVHHPTRLLTPMVRQDGKMKEVTWDEALSLVASKFSSYREEQFALICSSECSNEDSYIAQKFARVAVGSNNIDNLGRLSHASSIFGLLQSFGSSGMTNSIRELGDSVCIVLVGSGVCAEKPLIRSEIKRAVDKGAELIVINPQQIDLCRRASIWLQNLPGSDVALIMGMMKVIVDENLADWPFIAERCQNFEAFRKSLESLTSDFVERATGVAWKQIAEAARTYARRKPGAILWGTGITQHSHGVDNTLALCNLAMLTGNVGKPSSGIYPLEGENNCHGACDMGALVEFYPGYQPVSDEESRAVFESSWGCALSSKPGLTFAEIFKAISQQQIKALYLIGNPVVAEPLSPQMRNSLERLEFLVVQDTFPSEISQLADVVLPAASFAEKDGTFTSAERRVQRVRKAVEPAGKSRPDWQIMCQVAERMGQSGFLFEQSSQVMAEIAAVLPAYHGITYQKLDQGGLQWPIIDGVDQGTPVLHIGGFARGKGKFVPLEYKSAAELPDEDYPLLLSTEHSPYQMYSNVLSSKVREFGTLGPKGSVQISAGDAARLGISDGDMVKVFSRRGELIVKAVLAETL
ncbi:MAG: molybdopterin-dependent oxidoreductase, partial [Chloroflexota bacterium]|nr:molybdopterin-dependent oxidoreductase [Chloroflexota bacterium]